MNRSQLGAIAVSFAVGLGAISFAYAQEDAPACIRPTRPP